MGVLSNIGLKYYSFKLRIRSNSLESEIKRNKSDLFKINSNLATLETRQYNCALKINDFVRELLSKKECSNKLEDDLYYKKPINSNSSSVLHSKIISYQSDLKDKNVLIRKLEFAYLKRAHEISNLNSVAVVKEINLDMLDDVYSDFNDVIHSIDSFSNYGVGSISELVKESKSLLSSSKIIFSDVKSNNGCNVENYSSKRKNTFGDIGSLLAY